MAAWGVDLRKAPYDASAATSSQDDHLETALACVGFAGTAKETEED